MTATQPQATHQRSAGRKWLFAGAILALGVLWIAIRVMRGGAIAPGLLRPKADRWPDRPVGEVLMQEIPIAYQLIGSIQSRVPVIAASRVASRVLEVKVHAGDRVGRGELLVRLDAADFDAQIAQARAELAAAQAELTRASADHNRFSSLFKRGSVTASERDAAEAAYRFAAGRVAQARAAIAAARAASQYTVVRSPVDGVVVERMVEPGDMAMPGKPLVRLYDQGALRVELDAPEELAGRIAIAAPLEVRVEAAGTIYRTAVNEIVPAADPASRSFIVRAPLPGGQGLQPGMFARAAFTTGSQPTLTVPRLALTQIGQLQTVRVIADGAVQIRMVSVGRSFGDRVEVLAGVRAGERVVLDSHESP